MTKTIKVALAGAGAFGIKHLDGIRNIDGEMPDLRAICTATGIMIASAPIFFTKAERTATMVIRTRSWERGP